jgi:hypothetical protein
MRVEMEAHQDLLGSINSAFDCPFLKAKKPRAISKAPAPWWACAEAIAATSNPAGEGATGS